MTEFSSSPTTVELHFLSFDATGSVVEGWVGSWLQHWQADIELWLLLEQMHRFDFKGPELSEVQPLIKADALDTYGLRGRLFWETGQLEWRRLSPGRVRVVLMAEGSLPVPGPDGVQPVTETHTLEPHDSRLILWGTSKGAKDAGKFRELRVAGSVPIDDYPDAFERAAAGMNGVVYPVLLIRTYLDEEGKQRFHRFLRPTVCEEKSLLKPLPVVLQHEEDQNA